MHRILYKYLDIDGAITMFKNRTIRFTNATKVNDPFDCHPSLIDHSSAADGAPTKEWGDLMVETEFHNAEKLRDTTWICSLSKTYQSLLMWTHYAQNHTGVCVGLNIEKVLKNTPPLFCMPALEPLVWDVQYEDIIQRPSNIDPWQYQLSTKGKDWEYEQEVRLIAEHATRQYLAYTDELSLREQNGELIHEKEFPRDMPVREGECFDTLFLGFKIDGEKKNQIIQTARELNPNIKLYQMTVDENAFRLKAEEIK